MKKEQEVYNKKIYKDSIVLLIASIISAVFFVLGVQYNLLLKFVFYIILSAIIVKKSKNNAQGIINFGIVTSIIMIVTSIIGPSMFDLMILLLAIFFLIHLISYKIKFKKTKREKESKKI